MISRKSVRRYNVLSLLSFLVMVGVNALANILPINGISTGAISDSYPNLFAPAGFTFAIWGVIYLLLGVFIYHAFRNAERGILRIHFRRISLLFIVSNLANSVWIFTWHYRVLWLSMILMLVILGCLIFINRAFLTQRLTRDDAVFVKIPFGVYFGWITIATIANATTLLVSLGWNGGSIAEELWMILILLVALAIGGLSALKLQDLSYLAVLVWAEFGILMKHLSDDVFDQAYSGVILMVSISLVMFTLMGIFILYLNRRKALRRT
ncbi:MAG TPA: lantibiotic ABC transporter permease [Erysipelotrichaceae bacterium]|nr:lantibiotic ABC transporter permease [Erysipelotrichaceae bacterium]